MGIDVLSVLSAVGCEAQSSYNKLMRSRASPAELPSLGKEVDEVFADFLSACCDGIDPHRVSRIRGWLDNIPPEDRIEALRLLWFKIDEVDRRVNHMVMTILRSLGVEKVQEIRERLEDPDVAAEERAREEKSIEEIENDIESLDRVIGHAKRTIESGALGLETRWPAIVAKYGDPLGNARLPPVPPISFEFGSATNNPDGTFEEVRASISRRESGSEQSVPRRLGQRKFVERWLAKRYYGKRLGALGEEFIEFENWLSIDVVSAEYARRVFEWLMQIGEEDRERAFALARTRAGYSRHKSALIGTLIQLLMTANQWEVSIHRLKADLEKTAPETRDAAELGADLTEAEVHYESVLEVLEQQGGEISKEQLSLVEDWAALSLRYAPF